MSKLKELIEELCPDGVEYRKLGEVCDYIQPSKYIVESTDYNDNYSIPVLTAGESFLLGYTNETYGIFEATKNNPVIIFDDFTTSSHWVDFSFKVKSSAMKIITCKYEGISFKYIYYCIKNIDYVPAQHTRQWIQYFSNIEIPLPPLEVQEEIVRILDSFTMLEAELEAELEKRKIQYTFWRDKLLDRKENESKIYKLNEICEISVGGDIPKESFSKFKTKENFIPVVSNGKGKNALCGYTNIAKINEPSVTVSARGTIGYAEYRDYSYYPVIRLISVTPKDKNQLNTKYLYYWLQGKNYDISTSGIPQLTVPIFQKEVISVPSLEIQERIVEVLDNFDEICESLNIGLPAEIEKRGEQYAYYRDMLLTYVANNGIILETRDKRQETRDKRQGLIRLIQYVFGYANVKLGDIATEMFRGNGIKRNETTEYGIPCVRYGEIYTTYNIWFDECVSYVDEDKIKSKKYFENGDILFAITGESIEDIGKSIAYVGHDKCLAGGDIVVMKHNQNAKYLAYALSTETSRIQKSEGKVKSKVVHTNIPSLSEITIPLPSLEDQQIIVDILDKFDKLTNNFNEGIPSEIDKRLKQYEYYRNELLNFKKLEN